ncbi:hypothetical protein L7F22_010277 [Adiantum nelumboides]|nr:hypothetical protein [Adiantum nelumboides]
MVQDATANGSCRIMQGLFKESHQPAAPISSNKGLGIVEFLKGKTIFITRATGFLAKVLVEKILRVQSDVEHLFLLINADDVSHAKSRLQNEIINSGLFKNLKDVHGASYQKFMESKLSPIVGNLAKSNLGMDMEVTRDLQEKVEIIVNSAASTTFDESTYFDMVANAMLAAMARHANKSALEVYQVASSVVNPLVFFELARMSREHFREHPFMDKFGKPLVTPDLELFESMESFMDAVTTCFHLMKDDDVWYVDSSALNHMTNRGEWFNNMHTLQHAGYVQTGDDTTHPIAHTNYVPLSTRKGKEKYLADVFHVPNIIKNLVFVGQMVEQVLQVKFNGYGLYVEEYKKNGKLIAQEKKVGKIFTLNVNVSKMNAAMFAQGSGFVADVEIWHTRIGHANVQRLKLMQSKELVTGLP